MSSTLSRPQQASIRNSSNEPYSRPPLMRVERNLRTRGEIEASVCEGIIRFERERMGRGPKNIRAYLIGDLLVIRLSGVLTLSEMQLVNATDAEKGCALIKEVRTHLIAASRSVLEEMVQSATGVKAIGTLFDINIAIDEEFILFTLADEPIVRDTMKR